MLLQQHESQCKNVAENAFENTGDHLNLNVVVTNKYVMSLALGHDAGMQTLKQTQVASISN